MANADIGELTCPHLGHQAKVRRYKSGAEKLYYVCACGIIRPNLQPGQEWILANARMYTDQERAAAVDARIEAAAPPAPPAPAPTLTAAPPPPAPPPRPTSVRKPAPPAKAAAAKKPAPPATPAAPRRSLLPDL